VKRILVVGATGQLGSEVVRQAVEAGYLVRALARHGSNHRHLRRPGVEIVFGDLRDAASLDAAVVGITDVVATATVIFPRGPYSFDQDEGQGYRNLVSACVKAGTEHFTFVSVLPLKPGYFEAVPFLRMKTAGEELLRTSGLPHTVLRCAPFMDEYFAIMGSEIPLSGEVAASLNRCTGAARLMRRLGGRTIETLGLAFAPGPKTSRHAFVAVRDVAAFAVAAVGTSDGRTHTIDVAGPETLSWQDIADLYARLLKRRVRLISCPAWAFRLLARLSRPFSEALSNQMAVLWVLGENDTCVDARAEADRFGVCMTTAESYLTKKVGGIAR